MIAIVERDEKDSDKMLNFFMEAWKKKKKTYHIFGKDFTSWDTFRTLKNCLVAFDNADKYACDIYENYREFLDNERKNRIVLFFVDGYANIPHEIMEIATFLVDGNTSKKYVYFFRRDYYKSKWVNISAVGWYNHAKKKSMKKKVKTNHSGEKVR